MNKFLDIVANDLLQRSNCNLYNYFIIVPGKRSRSFLKYLISQKIDTPVLSPTILTINEFIEKESGLRLMEPVSAITLLYGLYKKKIENAETIDRFWFFGEMLHADFDDVDKHCADAAHLFRYVKDVKEIAHLFDLEEEEQLKLIRQFWSSLYRATDEKDESEVRKYFLKFWAIILSLYNEFREVLQRKGFGYEGMLYRLIAEKALADKLTFDDKIPVFVGFNALSNSERIIFESANRSNGLFYWDYDKYYVDNPIHEAGYFMRKNLKQFPSALSNPETFNQISKLKNITVIGLPGELEMAGEIALQISEQMQPSENPLVNGIVLGNESLMIPVLQTIPESVEGLNVTMGLPIQNTNLYGLVKLLLEMPAKQIIKGQNVFYNTEWVMEMLLQPFVNKENNEIIAQIRKQNLLYVSAKILQKNEWHQLLFPTEKKSLIFYLKAITHRIAELFNEHESNSITKVNAEAAILLYRSLNMLETHIVEQSLILPEPLQLRLINKIIDGLKLTLEGEPLRGTQMMGLIEARTLDFDHLIMAGVNEGCLPSSTVAPSFIPYNLRKAYGLLTYENQDAIFAYYFYRAIQRAKKLTFIYNCNDSDNDYGEKSRFLQQLEFELNLPINQITQNYNVSPIISSEFIIPKEGVVKQKLHQFLNGKKALYPAHLNTFINCSLKFYFKSVVELKEPEVVEQGIDHRIFGLVFHDTMEAIYKPFVEQQKIVNDSDIMRLMLDGKIHLHIRNSIKTHFSDIELHQNDNGMLALIEQVVLKYVKRVLANDKKDTPFLILGLESKYETPFLFDEQKRVNLAGKIDRLQQKENRILVVDYKTGRPLTSAPIFENMFILNEPNRSDASFQAMLYTRIIQEYDFSINKELIPSLLYIRENKPIHELSFSKRKDNSYTNLQQEFEEGLKNVLTDLFNFDKPFEQTQNEEQCSYCPYKVICNR